MAKTLISHYHSISMQWTQSHWINKWNVCFFICCLVHFTLNYSLNSVYLITGFILTHLNPLHFYQTKSCHHTFRVVVNFSGQLYKPQNLPSHNVLGDFRPSFWGVMNLDQNILEATCVDVHIFYLIQFCGSHLCWYLTQP